MSQVDEAVMAIREGRLAVVPTDTVYGLVCTPYGEGPARELSTLKGRAPEQPIALLAESVDWILESIPELRGRPHTVARALLPGSYTLVLPNPARRFPWLTGNRPDAIGIRVPTVTGPCRDVLVRLGGIAATSANHHGGPDPRRLEEVPAEIRAAAVGVDGGELPGVPSTVVDLTRPEPVVLREGAVPAAQALALVEAALTQ